MLNTDDIKNLAQLSRIHLSDEEMEGIRKDMDSILGYVSELQQVAASEALIEPTLKNVMREDIVTNPTGSCTDKILAAAPKKEGNYFKVKRIL
jgi:aspartyl-tRNA(Asn)/glutamyl-tRNA(Gln) amidotransferase subunit C